MEQLGYYAKDKNGDLFRFEHGESGEFFIFVNGSKILSNPQEYEILEIGFFVSE